MILKISNCLISLILVLIVSLSGCGKRYHLEHEDSLIESVWPSHRGGIESLGQISATGYAGKLDVIWETGSNDKPAGPITMSYGQLIYPGTKRKFKFYDGADGTYLGRVKAKGIPQTGITTSDSIGFFATAPKNNRISCFNLKHGNRLWRRRLRDAVSGSIILGDRLIASSAEGTTYAFAVSDGSVLWSFDCGSRLTAPPSFGHDKLFQPCDDGSLLALSIDDGSELYRTDLGGPLVGASAISELIHVANLDGLAFGISPTDGMIVWRRDLKDQIWGAPAVSQGLVLYGQTTGIISALDAASGEIRWSFDASEVIRSAPIIVGSSVVFGTMGGSLFSLDLYDGSLIARRDLGEAIEQSPVSDGSRVYVATEKGSIICLGENNERLGTITE